MTAAVATGAAELVADSPEVLSFRDFVAGSGLRTIVLGASKDPNAKVTVLLVSPHDGRAIFAVKVPTTDMAARAVEHERELLGRLSALPPELGDALPRIVGAVDFDGRPAMVTTALHGTAMTTIYLRWRHTASAARVGRDFAAAARWLGEFQTATAGQPTPIEMDAGVRSRLQTRFAGDPDLLDDLGRLDEVHERLRAETVARTALHGDFWFGNILLEEGRIAGVVDWESGALGGQPVRDLVRFAIVYSLYLDRRTKTGRAVSGHRGLRADRWGAGVDYVLDGSGWYPDLVRRFVSDGLERLGADPRVWRDAIVAGVAEIAAFTDDEEFGRRNLGLFRRLVLGRSGDRV